MSNKTTATSGSIATVLTFIICLLLIAGLTAWLIYSRANLPNAGIREMTVAGHSLSGSLILDFRKVPAGVTNPCDVRIVFSGICLEKEIVYDWNTIVEKSSAVNTAEGRPGAIAEGRPPPLKSPFRVEYALTPVTQIPQARLSDDIMLKADLYWGGKLQDSKEQATRHLFRRN